MPTLEQAVDERLADILAMSESGVSEMTGKLMYESRYGSEGQRDEVIGRFGGLNIRELQRAGVSPGVAARAIRRGSGKVFDRIESAARAEMEREGFKPARKRSAGRPVVEPHDGRPYCIHCKVKHTKGQHRFHGKGSFHRTHLFSFGGNPAMGISEAKRVFAELMARSREKGGLSTEEKRLLSRASQIIRHNKRSTATHRNPPKSKTFGALAIGAVFEFSGPNMPAGPWRKLNSDSFQLADGSSVPYKVKPSAAVRPIQPGLFSGPLFDNPKRSTRRPRRNDPRMRVAETILEQLGGSRFLAMTGARNLVGSSNSLTFKLPAAGKVKHVRIELTAADLYNVTFYGLRGRVLEEVAGVDASSLRAVIERHTGLYLSLGTMGAPRRNPGGLMRMGRTIELRYERDFGRLPGFYKHEFESRPVVFFDPRRNWIIIKGH